MKIYEFESLYGSSVERLYSFKTDTNRTYNVEFELVELKKKQGAALKVDYWITNQSPNFMTGDNEAFKILHTIWRCVEFHIDSINFDEYKALDYLIIRGVNESGEFGIDNKRSRVYMNMLQKLGYTPHIQTFYPSEYTNGSYIYILINKSL